MTAALAGFNLPQYSQLELYRDLLADRWDELPESVRAAHQVPLWAVGVMDVVRPSGILANLMADLTQLPRAGSSQSVDLDVRSEGENVIWRRTFAGRRYPESRHTLKGGLLIEQSGSMRLGFKLAKEGDCLRYEQRRFWIFGVPLPMPLALKVQAIVKPALEGWRVDVQITAPLVGMLCRYAGNMRAQ